VGERLFAGVPRWGRWTLLASWLLLSILGGCAGGAPLSVASITQQLLIGLVLGSIYALLALGYTLVYGVIKLINFAHSDVYMLGAFAGYYVLRFAIRWLNFTQGLSLAWCFVIAAVVSAVLCAVIAVVMERLAYRPLRKSTRIAALITAVGVSFLLENGGIVAFGANPKSFEPKTLPVYQVEVSPDAQFAGAQRQEVMDMAQLEVPDRSDQSYARVRLVSKRGTSEWSPALAIGSKDTDYVERLADDAADANSRAQAPGRLSYRRTAGQGRNVIVLNWQEGSAADVALPPVLSGANGEPLALEFANGALRIPLFNLAIVAVTVLVLWCLNVLVNRSMFGMTMRALSFDINAAKLMGIDTDRCISQTFAIGGACAGLAGCMVGLYNSSIDPLMGILPGLKAFVAAVVGGIGSIPGAALGGLIMGLSEALLKGYIDPRWSGLADAMAFALLIIVLLFRPSGLLGSTLREKV
jgi:branched-subunit amino acid ABC-type transport system permease component